MFYRRLSRVTFTLSAAFILFVCSLELNASSKSRIRYGGKQNDMPSAGLKFISFRDMTPIPFAPPKSDRLWIARTEPEKKIPGYHPQSLWMHDQVLGQWKSSMMTILVAEMRYNAPANIPRINPKFDDVSRESYSFWKSSVEHKWAKTDILNWMEFFAGARLSREPTPVKNCKSPTYIFESSQSSDNTMFFHVKDKRDPQRQFAFFYIARDSLSQKDKSEIIRSVKSISLYNPKIKKVAQVQSRSKYKKKQFSAKYLKNKAQVIDSIRNMRGWKYLETSNYLILSNMRSGATVKNFQEHIEKSRLAFQVFFPMKSEPDEVSVVKIFADRSEYLSYVGKDMEWSAGLWMPSRKELMVSPTGSKSRSKNQLGMQATTAHEGFHQYIYYATGQGNCSQWFNEGTAAFFEGIKFSGTKSFKVEPTWRYNTLISSVNRGYVDIRNFIRLTQTQYYEKASLSHNYAMGWGLMFYLFKGARVTKKMNYAKIPFIYYEALLKGLDPARATQVAWEGIDFKLFEKDFIKFWKSRTLFARATRLDIQKTLIRELSKR